MKDVHNRDFVDVVSVMKLCLLDGIRFSQYCVEICIE